MKKICEKCKEEYICDCGKHCKYCKFCSGSLFAWLSKALKTLSKK